MRVVAVKPPGKGRQTGLVQVACRTWDGVCGERGAAHGQHERVGGREADLLDRRAPNQASLNAPLSPEVAITVTWCAAAAARMELIWAA